MAEETKEVELELVIKRTGFYTITVPKNATDKEAIEIFQDDVFEEAYFEEVNAVTEATVVVTE